MKNKQKNLIDYSKNFPENWDSKESSVGTLLVYLDYGLNDIFLGIKPLCLTKFQLNWTTDGKK
jgi:hypothetical protein